MKFKYQFYYGSLVLAIILLGNIIYLSKSQSIVTTGQPNIPPYPQFLQNFTKPDAIRISAYEDVWFGFENSSNESETNFQVDDYKSVIRKPGLRSVVGIEYSHRLFRSGFTPQELTLIEGPPGFTISDGILKWSPTEHDVGRYPITITVDTAVEINFTLFVDRQKHYLGTNIRGDDLLGLMISGTVWLIFLGFIAVFFGVFVAVLFGAMGGYYGGKWLTAQHAMNAFVETVPGLLLIFLVAVISRFNIYVIMIAVGLLQLPINSKIIGNKVNEFVKMQFVEASIETGFKNKTILWRDIIYYNCGSLIIAQVFTCLIFAIVTEVTLSYLGLGLKLPDISLGELLRQGRGRLLYEEYWMFLFPTIAIVVAISGLRSLGQSLSEFTKRGG